MRAIGGRTGVELVGTGGADDGVGSVDRGGGGDAGPCDGSAGWPTCLAARTPRKPRENA